MICIDFYRFYPSPRNSLSVSWLVRLFVCALVTFIFPNFQIFRYFSEFFKVFSRIFRIFPKSMGDKKYVSVSTWKVLIPRAISIKNVRFFPPRPLLSRLDHSTGPKPVQLVHAPFTIELMLQTDLEESSNRYKSVQIQTKNLNLTKLLHILLTHKYNFGTKKNQKPPNGKLQYLWFLCHLNFAQKTQLHDPHRNNHIFGLYNIISKGCQIPKSFFLLF